MPMMPMKQNAVEKFPVDDLSDLRTELMHSGLDSWQAAEVISSFLSGRGYGVSHADARSVATRMDSFSLETMQVALEQLAFVM